MATLKQKKAFNSIVEKSRTGGTLGEALLEANYSPNTAIKPSQVMKSKGFKELCEEAGLTDDFLITALRDDIEKKPQNRKPELELAFKVTGKLNETPQENKTLIINIGAETNKRYEVPPITESSRE